MATALQDKLLPPGSSGGRGGGRGNLAPTELPYESVLHPALSQLLGGVTDPKALQEETLALLQTLIRNKCVNAGDGRCEEIASIETLREFLAGYGIACEVVHPPGKPKRPSLLASYGSGEGPRVMLGPGHVDVVPANPEIWTQDPWAAKVVDGRVYGRGSVDMLSTVAAQAVAFAHIAKAQVPLRGTLLFCAVSDEEAGGADGAGFLMADPALREKFRADYCMTEVGGPTLIDRYGRPTKTYVQSNGEKGIATVEVVCKGRAGHGSLPKGGDNALAKAAGVVQALQAYCPPTAITPEWCSLVRAIDVPRPVAWLLESRWFAGPVVRLLLAVGHPFGIPAYSLTRMTLSPNHVTGTLKVNIVPGTATVHVDARTLPGQDEAYIRAHIERALGRRRMASGDYEIRIAHFFPATTSPIDTPLWRAMAWAAGELVPGATFAHPIISGSTDSRYFRRYANTVAYGAALYHPSLDFARLLRCYHGEDENLPLASLQICLHFYLLTALRMLGPQQQGEQEDKEKAAGKGK